MNKGYKLRELRIENNKLQKEVAKYLNISRQYYSEYERGLRKLPTEVIIKLSKYYKVTTDYILGLKNK